MEQDRLPGAGERERANGLPVRLPAPQVAAAHDQLHCSQIAALTRTRLVVFASARSGAARQEQRRPPDMLYVVGLGLGEDTTGTVKGLEAVHGAVRGV
jgi:hypothetical protein